MYSKIAFATGIAALVFSGNTLAHHSHAHYESESNTVLEGTIKDVEWRSPHSWVTITVANEKTGVLEDWLLEARSPGALARRGWAEDSLKQGDQVAITIRPLRSGGTGGLLRDVELADGTVLLDD
jgi:hypothetical protein